MEKKKKDPWTDPDPQPGDFDEEIERATPDQIEIHEGNPDATLTLISDEEAVELLGPERAARLGIIPPKQAAKR